MREYILTERERNILKAFLESGLKLEGFTLLRIRMGEAYGRLKDDLSLVEKALEKLREEA